MVVKRDSLKVHRIVDLENVKTFPLMDGSGWLHWKQVGGIARGIMHVLVRADRVGGQVALSPVAPKCADSSIPALVTNFL